MNYLLTCLRSNVVLIAEAKNPVILSGGGVVMGGEESVGEVRALAEFLQVPVATTYLHIGKHIQLYTCTQIIDTYPI